MSKFDDLIATKKFVQQQAFFDKIYPKRFNSFKNCIETNQNGQTAQKPKSGQKLKKTQDVLKTAWKWF